MKNHVQRRKLTSGEIDLARLVFGDAIDYAKVEVTNARFTGFHPKGVAMAPDGNLYMPECYSTDYAAESSYWRGCFIHEMAHVWQFQQKILNPVTEALMLNYRHAFNYRAAYDYRLETGKDLLDYNMEQQASILQDYFMRTLENENSWEGRCKNKGISDDQRRDLYESVLKNFAANPSYARRAEFPAKSLRPKK